MITDQIEEHLQNFARGEIPLVPWVTSANGDGAYGSAAASGRPTCAFLVFIDVERAAAVLRAELLVVPRVSLSCGAAGVADFDNTLSLLCPGSVPRVLAALERVCALADGAERDDGELVCMLERAGRGQFASRKVYWASFLTKDCVWVRVYGLVDGVGKRETAFARVMDFGPYGAAAARRSHRLACKPKTEPPPSRLDKKYMEARRVPCGGVARLIARAEEVDDRELIEEIAEDDADALDVERADELDAAAADEPAAAPVSAGAPAPVAAPPSATAPAPAAAESLAARVYTQPPMTPAATRRRVSTGYTDEARRVAGELRLEDDMINTDLVRRIAMVHHAFPNEDGTPREPLADAVRGLVFDDESKDDGGDDMETT